MNRKETLPDGQYPIPPAELPVALQTWEELLDEGDPRVPVAVLWLGGTMGSVRTKDRAGVHPGLTGEQFRDQYVGDTAKDFFKIDIFRPTGFPPEGIDSTNITNEQILALHDEIFRIKTEHPEYIGILVCMGTDGLEYAAQSTAFAFQNLTRPIAFTGAQIRPTDALSDASGNFEFGLKVLHSPIAEVVVVFRDQVFRAAAVSKVDAIGKDAFDSPHQDAIGHLRGNVFCFENVRHRPHPQPNALHSGLKYYRGQSGRIFSAIKITPQTSTEDFEDIDFFGYDAVMIEGYAAGNIPQRLFGIIKRYAEQIQFIIVPRCQTKGGMETDYEVNPKLQFSSSVIYAARHTASTAYSKYRMLHAQGTRLGLAGSDLRQWIASRFDYDLAGELSQGVSPNQEDQALLLESAIPHAPSLHSLKEQERALQELQLVHRRHGEKSAWLTQWAKEQLRLDDKSVPTLGDWVANRLRIAFSQRSIEGTYTADDPDPYQPLLETSQLVSTTLTIEAELLRLKAEKIATDRVK